MKDNKFNLTEEQVYKIYRTLYDIIGEKYGVQIDFTLKKREDLDGEKR